MRMVIICKNDVAFKYSLTKILLEYEVAVAVNVMLVVAEVEARKKKILGSGDLSPDSKTDCCPARSTSISLVINKLAKINTNIQSRILVVASSFGTVCGKENE